MSLRIGLIGASRIAPPAMLRPAKALADVEILSVAAADPARAEAFAAEHALPSFDQSYQHLIARRDIDLVYLSLPPSAHARWAIAALESGKHVLMEKPFTRSAEECAQVQAAAKAAGRRAIEATHYRYHPMIKEALAALGEGPLGAPRRMRAGFSVPVAQTPQEFRWRRDLGGGCLRDIGFYPLHLARSVFGQMPEIVDARADWAESGVDGAFAATLRFADGATAELSCDMRAGRPTAADAEIECANGALTLSSFVQPARGALTMRDGTADRTAPPHDRRASYYFQLEAVRDALQTGAPLPTEGPDTLAQMQMLDRLYAAAVQGDAKLG